MKLGESDECCRILKTDIIHIMCIDVGDKALEFVEVLVLLIICKIYHLKRRLILSKYREDLGKTGEDAHLIELARVIKVDLHYLEEKVIYLLICIGMCDRIYELGLLEKFRQVIEIIHTLQEVKLKEENKSLAFGITLDLVRDTRGDYQDVAAVKMKFPSVGDIFISVLYRYNDFRGRMTVLGIAFDLEVIPDTDITVGGEDYILNLVDNSSFDKVPKRLVIAPVRIKFHFFSLLHLRKCTKRISYISRV